MASREERRNQTLKVLKRYFEIHGDSPTYEELAHLLGVSSTAARNRVRDLRQIGKVEVLDNMWRNIVLVKEQGHV